MSIERQRAVTALQSDEPAYSSNLSRYLPSLDGWRAIAILMVLSFHASESLALAYGTRFAILRRDWQPWGTFGVEIFFAISGLLITTRLLSEERRTGWIDLKGFYIRRAFRILPASLLYLFVLSLLGVLGVIALDLRSWRAALFFYTNFIVRPLWYTGHFWSLAVEEHFYVFWPAFLVFVERKTRLSWTLVLCLVVALWRFMNIKHPGISVAMHSPYYTHLGRTDFRVDGILWGAALALAYAQFASKSWIRRVLNLPIGLGMLLIVFGSIFVHTSWQHAQVLLLCRKVLMPVLLLTTIVNCRGVVALVLENRGLKWIGKLSYSLYLWQQLFLIWSGPGGPTRAHVSLFQRWPYNIIGVLICAILSYYFIEQPSIEFGRRVLRRIENPMPNPIIAEAMG